MTPEQYQLLRALRPSGEDGSDPQVAAAFAAAQLYPDILKQLAEEQKIDCTLRAALAQVEPPADLAANLFTAMRAARGSVEPPDSLEETVLSAVKMPAPVSGNPPSFSRRQWLGFATAAAAALVAGSTYWWRFLAFTMSHLTRQLATISAEGVKLSLMSMDPGGHHRMAHLLPGSPSRCAAGESGHPPPQRLPPLSNQRASGQPGVLPPAGHVGDPSVLHSSRWPAGPT